MIWRFDHTSLLKFLIVNPTIQPLSTPTHVKMVSRFLLIKPRLLTGIFTLISIQLVLLVNYLLDECIGSLLEKWYKLSLDVILHTLSIPCGCVVGYSIFDFSLWSVFMLFLSENTAICRRDKVNKMNRCRIKNKQC